MYISYSGLVAKNFNNEDLIGAFLPDKHVFLLLFHRGMELKGDISGLSNEDFNVFFLYSNDAFGISLDIFSIAFVFSG